MPLIIIFHALPITENVRPLPTVLDHFVCLFAEGNLIGTNQTARNVFISMAIVNHPYQPTLIDRTKLPECLSPTINN